MWPFVRKGASGFSSYSTAEQVTKDIDGSGLTAIVTGANSGIGKETARVLALRGVHVVIGARNVVAGNEAKESILKETPSAKVDVLQLDLSSLDSVRSFASEFDSLALPLNILINNAGTMANPFSLSKDKIELQFATNYLGHFLLTNLLLDNMKKTAQHSKKEGRIIDLSSEAHRFGYPEGIRFDKINDEASYSSFKAYSQSKLACLLHGNELARRLKEEGALVTANTVEPGFVATNVLRHMGWLQGVFDVIGKVVAKNVQQGAATTCYVALHPNVKGVYGEYFGNCNVSKASALGSDAELAKKLWDFSENLVQ